MAPRSSDASRPSHMVRRILLLAVVVGFILAAEQWILVVVHPGQSAELAVNQLQPSDEAAAKLRLCETVNNTLPVIRYSLIALAALALFADVLVGRPDEPANLGPSGEGGQLERF